MATHRRTIFLAVPLQHSSYARALRLVPFSYPESLLCLMTKAPYPGILYETLSPSQERSAARWAEERSYLFHRGGPQGEPQPADPIAAQDMEIYD